MGRIFPWISLLLIAYLVNGIFFGVPLDEPIWTFAGGPDGRFGVTAADIIIFAGFVLLIVEMLTAAMNAGNRTMLNHILSLAVFVIGVGVFIGVPSLRSMALLHIIGLMLIDLTVGVWVTNMVSRNLIAVDPSLRGR